MMEQICVELACYKDFDVIQKLFRMMFDIFYENQNREYPYTQNGIEYLSVRIEEGFAFVAKSEGRVVGFLLGSIEKSIDFKTYDKYGFMENMYVLEEYRKKGAGKMLKEEFVKKCRDLGIRFIHTDSDADQDLMNFYTGTGFKISGINYTMKI